ncbi:hypothetical protein M0812_29188 [Anaeramoeba flamelloides]|uniref:Uncharacterized protein n=1 Tax=Anaeramoeba flamelloides TaxID=1746091 RepID=A0AAV7Y3M3_9EUKA|nr:hypothetical protein M0812_29188 [Anaeramoeba flamelloides]
MNRLKEKTKNKTIQKNIKQNDSLQDLKMTVKSLDTGIRFRKIDILNEPSLFQYHQKKDQRNLRHNKNKNKNKNKNISHLNLSFNTKNSKEITIPRKIPQTQLQKSTNPNPNGKMFLSLDNRTFLNGKFNDLFETNNTKFSSIKSLNSSSIKRHRRRPPKRVPFTPKTLDYFEDEY